MGDSMDDWRAEYRVDADATEFLEKTLGVTDSLLAAVEVKDTHDPLTMTSSRVEYSTGVAAMASLLRLDRAVRNEAGRRGPKPWVMMRLGLSASWVAVAPAEPEGLPSSRG